MPGAVWEDERAASMRYIAAAYSALGDERERERWLLRCAAENGDLQNIIGNANSPQAEQLRRELRDPEAAKKLLSTPAAQKLFEALGGQK